MNTSEGFVRMIMHGMMLMWHRVRIHLRGDLIEYIPDLFLFSEIVRGRYEITRQWRVTIRRSGI